MPKESSATGRWLKRFAQGLGGEPQDRQELITLLRESAHRGLLDGDALNMVEGALQVGDLQVRDIMVPRSQVVFVRRDDPPQRLLAVVVESGHSRFPVLDADKDDIVGILLAKDLLRLAQGARAGAAFDIREYMRTAVFVPEAKRLDVLLRDFQRQRNHMAIVIDEYGGVAGLVTIEDVIEQILGDIDDEFDVEEEHIRREGERLFTVRGITRIDEFNEFFGAQLSEEEGVDTVAGLLMRRFGRLPRRGEVADIRGYEFRVLRADRRRIDALRVVPPADAHPPGENAAEA